MSDRIYYLSAAFPFALGIMFERVEDSWPPPVSIPDGETGERLGWMGLAELIFVHIRSAKAPADIHTPGGGSEISRKYRLKAGFSPYEVRFDNLPVRVSPLTHSANSKSQTHRGHCPPSVRVFS